ncbi:MAG TPA: potassium channel family protein [Thermomicrobiales bacterium]|jgi:hypothetical protein
MLLTIVCTALGTSILLAVYFDLWATVLHPGIESPLSNRFHRAAWRILCILSKLAPRADRLLYAGLPLLIGGLILLWLILLGGGFALLYYPWIGNPAAFDMPPDATGSWFDALYVSGSTLFTLGYGDITPLTKPLRALAILEAGSGMATISFAVAYVLAVYPALSRLRIRATALDAEVAGQTSGVPMLRRYLLSDGRWNGDMDDRLREMALELLELTENHEAHPILYYSHPPRVEQSILRMLLTIQQLIGLLRYGLSPERHDDLVHNPQVLLLEQSFSYSLRRLTVSLHTSLADSSAEPLQQGEYHEAFARLCDELERLGLVSSRQRSEHPVSVLAQGAPDMDTAAVATDEPPADTARLQRESGTYDPAFDQNSGTASEAYIAFRVATDRHIAAYAASSGYTIAEALHSDEAAWEGGGRR